MTPLADQKVYVIAVVYAEEKEEAETSVIKATAVVSDTWKWQMKIPIKELPQNSKLLWNELSCLSLDECVSDSVFDRSLLIKRKLKVVYWRKRSATAGQVECALWQSNWCLHNAEWRLRRMLSLVR